MKKIVSLILASAMLMALAAFIPALTACDSSKTINLLNWGEYLDPELKTEFKKRTGITVNEKPVTSNEEMLQLLEADDCPYDLCIPSDYAVQRLIKGGKLAEINYDNIPNIKNIDKKYIDITNGFDPGNKHSVPYTWGVLGVLYNTTMVDEADLGSWDLLWNEKYKGEILMYDSIRDAMAAALCRKGYSLNTVNEAEINEAANDLIADPSLYQAWVTDEVKEIMIGGGAAIALVYSGDAVWMMEPEEGNTDLEFYVPKEGSNIYFDNFVIPVNSKKNELAEQFINFLLDPEVAAQNTEYIFYSTPNTEVPALLGEFLSECSAFNIPAEDVANCDIYKDLGEDIKLYNTAWDMVLAKR
ncbi:MAG: ABC transporter substrate-binding protein [Clostridia bacterium]|nr:ABC transporter substrate-binding protein [Clostridia bacterium]